MGDDEEIPCIFRGLALDRSDHGILKQNQHFYLMKLKALPLSALLKELKSMRMKLAWLANTQPDCQFEIWQMAQETEERFNAEKSKIIRGLNKATCYATDNRTSLKVPKLDMSTVRIVGFPDASFPNNADLST